MSLPALFQTCLSRHSAIKLTPQGLLRPPRHLLRQYRLNLMAPQRLSRARSIPPPLCPPRHRLHQQLLRFRPFR